MSEPSHHRCMIYDGDPCAQLPRIASIAAEHLRINYRCLYLNRPQMVAAFESNLAEARVDTVEAVRRGALVLSSDQAHLVDGIFDPQRMLAMLRSAVRQASSNGFAGLWASGDMLWEFGSERNLSKLLAYEVGVQELMEQEPTLRGVCQYHRDSLPANAVLVALYTHQALHVKDRLHWSNPHYRSLTTLRNGSKNTTARVDEMLHVLRDP